MQSKRPRRVGVVEVDARASEDGTCRLRGFWIRDQAFRRMSGTKFQLYSQLSRRMGIGFAVAIALCNCTEEIYGSKRRIAEGYDLRGESSRAAAGGGSFRREIVAFLLLIASALSLAGQMVRQIRAPKTSTPPAPIQGPRAAQTNDPPLRRPRRLPTADRQRRSAPRKRLRLHHSPRTAEVQKTHRSAFQRQSTPASVGNSPRTKDPTSKLRLRTQLGGA